MRIHNVTPWDAGNILTSCADYLGAKEEDLREAGYIEEANILRESRFKIRKCFNKLDQWDFALPDSEPTPGASGREKIPFHECYILIEVDDDGEEHASFYSSPAARDKATLDAIWFGGPDDGHKEEAEHYLSELREKGFLAFEGDPPLRWRTLSDYVKQSESALAAAREEGKALAFEEQIPRLQQWLEAYSIDFFTEKPPYRSTDSAAAAMGRHILGLLIKDYQGYAAASRAGGGK